MNTFSFKCVMCLSFMLMNVKSNEGIYLTPPSRLQDTPIILPKFHPDLRKVQDTVTHNKTK